MVHSRSQRSAFTRYVDTKNLEDTLLDDQSGYGISSGDEWLESAKLKVALLRHPRHRKKQAKIENKNRRIKFASRYTKFFLAFPSFSHNIFIFLLLSIFCKILFCFHFS